MRKRVLIVFLVVLIALLPACRSNENNDNDEDIGTGYEKENGKTDGSSVSGGSAENEEVQILDFLDYEAQVTEQVVCEEYDISIKITGIEYEHDETKGSLKPVKVNFEITSNNSSVGSVGVEYLSVNGVVMAVNDQICNGVTSAENKTGDVMLARDDFEYTGIRAIKNLEMRFNYYSGSYSYSQIYSVDTDCPDDYVSPLRNEGEELINEADISVICIDKVNGKEVSENYNSSIRTINTNYESFLGFYARNDYGCDAHMDFHISEINGIECSEGKTYVRVPLGTVKYITFGLDELKAEMGIDEVESVVISCDVNVDDNPDLGVWGHEDLYYGEDILITF